MIKNIVFDMGGVLLLFDSKYLTSCATSNKEDIELLHENIFCCGEWAKMDDGSMNEESAYQSIIKRLPENLHNIAHEIVFEWDKWSYQINDSDKLLKELKNKGYRLFLLSNASSRLHQYASKIIKGFELLDGVMVSADVKLVKPNIEIFKEAEKKFDINPNETLFIDDTLMNVNGALSANWDAIHFVDKDKLIIDLKNKGVEL